MKIDANKLDIVLAQRCMSLTDLRQASFASLTLKNIRAEKDVTTKTAGRLAKHLNVDVRDIIKQEG